MCPVCVATATAIVAGSTAGTGGIAAVISKCAKWFRRDK